MQTKQFPLRFSLPERFPMPIPVICPGCKTGFQVSEKFAGKQGPCPKCKTVITIPEVKQDDIVIHAPEHVGPKDSTGRPVFHPILRQETQLSSTAIFGIAAAVACVLLIALVLRLAEGDPPPVILAIGAVALAPPLGIAGYAALRDQELMPYRGTSLAIRVAASSAMYLVLWGAFLWLPPLVGIEPATNGTYSPYALLMIVPVMMAIGGLTAYVAYDLEFGQALMHYGLYLAVTVILSWLAGVSWIPADL
jgi:hypothetical protein